MLLWVWAAAAPPDPNWVSYLGPFIPFGGLAVLVIIWQQRQMMAKDERIVQKDEKIAQLSDRVVEQAEKVAPMLADATSALEDAARELSRRDGR